MKPRPLQILVISGSKVTLAMLNTMLYGFFVTLVSSQEDTEAFLRNFGDLHAPLDFIILDTQTESHAEDLSKYLSSLHVKAFSDTKIVHLYTPTTSLSGNSVFGSNTPGVIKMTKPPRKARLLQTLAGLKELPNTMTSNPASQVAKAMEDLAAAQRTLFGNVLIAEGVSLSHSIHFSSHQRHYFVDNPIAQNLLVKQLERYHLNVTATSNGNEALERKTCSLNLQITSH